MRPVNLMPDARRRGRRGVAPGRTGPAVYVLLGALALSVLGAAALASTSKHVKERKSTLSELQQEQTAAKAPVVQILKGRPEVVWPQALQSVKLEPYAPWAERHVLKK